MSASIPCVAVIIPVYRDDGGLRQCLRALDEQDYPRDLVEVIVIDNGGNPDQTAWHEAYQGVRVVSEQAPGSYHARNTGLAQTQAEVIAFTDADCIPAPGWLRAGVRALQESLEIGLVGGSIELTFARDNHPSLTELYDQAVNFDQASYIERDQYSVTANLFARRAVVDAVGPFDANLKSGGDREWGNRVAAKGYQLVYEPNALVRHPARHGLGETLRKARRVSGGTVARLRRNGQLDGWLAHARYLLLGLAPPLAQIRLASQRLPTLPTQRRLGLLLLLTLVKWARTFEAARTMLGADPRR